MQGSRDCPPCSSSALCWPEAPCSLLPAARRPACLREGWPRLARPAPPPKRKILSPGKGFLSSWWRKTEGQNWTSPSPFQRRNLVRRTVKMAGVTPDLEPLVTPGVAPLPAALLSPGASEKCRILRLIWTSCIRTCISSRKPR